MRGGGGGWERVGDTCRIIGDVQLLCSICWKSEGLNGFVQFCTVFLEYSHP